MREGWRDMADRRGFLPTPSRCNGVSRSGVSSVASRPDVAAPVCRRHEGGVAIIGRRRRPAVAGAAAVLALIVFAAASSARLRSWTAWIAPLSATARAPRNHGGRGLDVSRDAQQSTAEAPPKRPQLADAVANKDRVKNAPAMGHQTWTDYTRYALGIEDYGPAAEGQPAADQAREGKGAGRSLKQLLDRRRAIGVDFGPQFTGMALSLGGVNTVPMGTLQTGEDWTELAIKIAQIASTRRARDIVLGYPLEKDGTEGKIGKLVRHFGQILADATLLVVGTNSSVYLWDERFSTTYAAMRLVARPRFDSGAFKSWLDGQRGLSFGAKALLDAEAARAILEHFLEKNPATDEINKDRSERVAPSREACLQYLRWRKKPLVAPKRPKEPAGPGKEGWEFDDAHPWLEEMSPEEYMQQAENFSHYMEGSDYFGDRHHEWGIRSKRLEEEKRVDAERRAKQDLASIKQKFRSAGIEIEDKHTPINDPEYSMDG